MKTITEYRPLIFGEMMARSEKRKAKPQRGKWFWGGIVAYSVAGLLLLVDTGLAPWNWQFWLVFGPLFVAGELIAREFSTRQAAIQAFVFRRYQPPEIPFFMRNPAYFACNFPQMRLHRISGTVIPAHNACYTTYQDPIVATDR